MDIGKIKTADKILIFIILLPIFLFGLNLFIELNQKPNVMNVAIYLAILLLIIIGMVLVNLAKTKESNTFLILGGILVFMGVFGTSYLSLFTLKEVASLIFVGVTLIFLILIYIVLKK